MANYSIIYGPELKDGALSIVLRNQNIRESHLSLLDQPVARYQMAMPTVDGWTPSGNRLDLNTGLTSNPILGVQIVNLFINDKMNRFFMYPYSNTSAPNPLNVNTVNLYNRNIISNWFNGTAFEVSGIRQLFGTVDSKSAFLSSGNPINDQWGLPQIPNKDSFSYNTCVTGLMSSIGISGRPMNRYYSVTVTIPNNVDYVIVPIPYSCEQSTSGAGKFRVFVTPLNTAAVTLKNSTEWAQNSGSIDSGVGVLSSAPVNLSLNFVHLRWNNSFSSGLKSNGMEQFDIVAVA